MTRTILRLRRSVIVASLVAIVLSPLTARAQSDTSDAPLGEPTAPITKLTSAAFEASYPSGVLVSRRNGRRKETAGVLVADPQGRLLRFEANDSAAVEMAYDAITALQYYRGRTEHLTWSLLRKVEHHLVIHYLDEAGQERFATLNFSKNAMPAVLNAVEKETGTKIDRTLSPGSFLGLPVRVGVGDRVAVTEWSGWKTTNRRARQAIGRRPDRSSSGSR